MELDNYRGTYALISNNRQGAVIQVGALGGIYFKPGYYVYVGSAFGPGGLHARGVHHLTPVKKCQWHIDYLRQKAEIVEIWFSKDPARREHEWADVFNTLPGLATPVPRFGVSDCRCSTHLFHFLVYPRMDIFCEQLLQRDPDHATVQRFFPDLV
jgi:Uri superfamily endonuclease